MFTKKLTDLTLLFYVTIVTLALSGCIQKKDAQADARKPVEALPVKMIHPTQRQVVDYEEFVGRMLPYDQVDVRARVSGTLIQCTFKKDASMKTDPQTGKAFTREIEEIAGLEQGGDGAEFNLKEGAEVKEGQLLFVIDPDVYEAALLNAQGQLEVLEARRERMKNDLDRAESLLPQKAISKQDYDLARFNLKECDAQIAVAKATIKTAQINLNYTRIYAPIDGYVGYAQESVGNLVQGNAGANSTTLVKIVKVDPIYIYLNIDESSVEKLKKIDVARREANPDADLDNSVEFRLSDEDGFPHQAKIDYHAPILDRSTGARLVRAVCPNPKLLSGERQFQPGMTVHVRVGVTDPYDALLVPEDCLGTNQSERFVYVVGEDGMPKMQIVQLGPLQSDNMRVIRKGLSKDDNVIADNLMRVRLDRAVKSRE